MADALSYKCSVVQVQTSGSDDDFVRSNLEKTFLITILDDQIIAAHSSNSYEPSQDSYTIVNRGLLGINSVTLSSVGLGTLSIENAGYKDEVDATVTVQGTFFVNVWKLRCKKL